MASNLSCSSITILVLVSFLNIILLVSVYMTYNSRCEESQFENLPSKLRIGTSGFERQLSLFDYTRSTFMAALCVIKYNDLMLKCSAAIVGKYWVLTTASCCHQLKKYSLDKIKVTSNSIEWKGGIMRAIDRIIIHERYNVSTVTQNLCLIRVNVAFNQPFETPVALASAQYFYAANSSAQSVLWNREGDFRLIVKNVRLVQYQACKQRFRISRIDQSMVCGRYYEASLCNFDAGAALVQNNALIGLVSFETDCASGDYPKVYTRVGYFEKWFRLVERKYQLNIGLKFRSK